MPTRFFILLLVGVLALAIMRTDSPVVKVQEKQTVYRDRVRVQEVVIGKRPDGYMTEDQCRMLAEGTDLPDLLWRYGWPAGEDATMSYAGYLLYPLREDHSRYCQIDIWRGEVEDKKVEV